MKFDNIISAERVACNLSVASKKKALEELAKLLAQGASELAETEVFSSLVAREKLGSTGLGHGVAIPHGRASGVSGSVGAFIKLQHPVDYDSHDGQAVDLLFGLLVPQEAKEEHLQHLAAIAEMFSDEKVCGQLRDASDAEALFKTLTGA